MKNKLKKLVHKLQSNNPKLAVKLAQAVNQALVDSPSVQIDPSIQKDVQSAVDKIRQSDPSFFKGVSKIVGLTGGPFGKVESTDPTVIHVNLSRIKQQVQQQMGSNYKPSDPKHQEALKEALERSIVETVSHERAHVLDFDPEQNKFPGGEGVAESGGKSMMQKMYQNKPIELQASFDYLIRQCEGEQFYWNMIPTVRQAVLKEAEEHLGEPFEGFEELMNTMEELRFRYRSSDYSSMSFYDDRLKTIDKYFGSLKKTAEQWKALVKEVDQIRQTISFLKKHYDEVQKMSMPELEAAYVALASTHLSAQSGPTDVHLMMLYRGMLLSKIARSNDVKVLTLMSLSGEEMFREAATKKLKELSKEASSNKLLKTAVLVQKVNKNTGNKEWALVSKQDHDRVLEWYGVKHPSKERVEKTEKRVQYFKHKAAQVAGMESSSSGQGVDEYNKTGNDYMAGGTSVIPWQTRLQELYKKFKKKEKKAGTY